MNIYKAVFPFITIIDHESAIGQVIDTLDDIFAPDAQFNFLGPDDILNLYDAPFVGQVYIIYVLGKKPKIKEIRQMIEDSGYLDEDYG